VNCSRVPAGIFLMIFFIMSLEHTLCYGRGVKFERHFMKKDSKINERIILSESRMRVDGSDYSYLIDIPNKILLYLIKGKKQQITMTFSELKGQIKRFNNKWKEKDLSYRVKVGSRIFKYRGMDTIKVLIVPTDKGFITTRLLRWDRRGVIIKNFYQNLLKALGGIPMVFRESGFDAKNEFNEVFYMISEALSYGKIGVVDIPVFILRPGTVTQIDISNIVSYSAIDDDFLSGFTLEKKEDNFIIFLQNLWKDMKRISGLFLDKFSAQESREAENKPEGGEDNSKAWKRVKRASDAKTFQGKGDDKFDYSILWARKHCGLYSSSDEKLVLMEDEKRGYIISKDTSDRLKKAYREAIISLNRIGKDKRGAMSRHVEGYLYKKFKEVLSLEALKKVNVEKTSFVRHNKLCHIKSRLYKKYMVIIGNR